MRNLIALSGVFAALAFSAPAMAQMQQTGEKNFCLRNATGAVSCIYASMAECDKAKSGASNTCIPNPKMTTGSGSNTMMPDKK